MAILTAFTAYTKVFDINTYWMVQVDLSGQYIKDISEVYVQRATPLFDVLSLTKSEDIESEFKTLVNDAVDDIAYFQFKDDVLHIISKEGYITYTTDSFYFVATRLSSPIESLDDSIDIPNTLVPLFVQKVLSNVYQLQGKETPLSIKRRIKELE